MVWSEGDQLFVYGTKACGVLTLVDGADEETATFSGFINGNTSDIQYATFGFDKSSTPENVTFTLGTVNADECNAPMFGTFNSTNNSIELRNLCGLVKVTISDMVNGKDDASITGKGIAGTLKLENGKLVPGTANATITVDGIEDGESFYVPMFAPQDKTPVELTVTYNGAEDKQVVNLKAGALNISDMPDSYYYKDGKLYSDNLNDDANVTVQGNVLKNEDGEYIVSENEGLEFVLDLNEEDIVVNLASDLTVNVKPWQALAFGGEKTKTITINGNGNTLTFNQEDPDWNHVTTANNAKLTINNAHITSSGHNDGPWNRHDINFACPVELVDVISDKAIALKSAATLTNVTINDANTSDTYAIWIQPNGQTVDIEGCTIDMLDCTDGRGIKIDNQYRKEGEEGIVTLNVSGTTFKTEEKSAIIVKTTLGANINLEGNDITGVAADKVCAVWVDEDAPTTFDLVNVTGGNKRLEGRKYFVDENGIYWVTDGAGLTEAIKEVKANSTIKLQAGAYENVSIQDKVAENITIEGSKDAFVKGIACKLPAYTQNVNGNLKGLTIKNVMFLDKGFYLTDVKNTAPWGFIENFKMLGCEMTGVGDEDIEGNRLFDFGTDSPGSHQIVNITIENCKVNKVLQGIRLGGLHGKENVIKGNEINNVAHNGITLRSVGNDGLVTVENNNISNGKDRALRIGANNGTVVFKGNVITKTGDEEGSNFKANTLGTVKFEGNTVDGVVWNPLD